MEAYKERLSKRQKFEGDQGNPSSSTKVEGEDEEEVKPVVPLSACLEAFAADETVADYQSPVTGTRGTATKRVRMDNFPRYLLVQLGRCVYPCGLARIFRRSW